MTVQEALELAVLKTATLVAGEQGLHRDIALVSVSDLPDVHTYVESKQLLLTTGLSWSQGEDELLLMFERIAQKGISGICLGVGKYVSGFSQALKTRANELALPLIEVPWETSFVLVTHDINGLITIQQADTIRRSEQIHKALTKTALSMQRLEDLALALGKQIQRPVTIEGKQGERLAEFWPDHVQKSWEVKTNFRRLLKHHTKLLKDDNALKLAASTQSVASVVCRIQLNHATLGWIRILGLEEQQALSELEFRAAEHAALVASLYLLKKQQIALAQERLGYSFLDALLEFDHKLLRKDQLQEQARLMGFAPSSSHRLVVIALDLALPLTEAAMLERERFMSDVKAILQHKNIPLLMTLSTTYIYLVLSANVSPSELWQALLNRKETLDPKRQKLGFAGLVSQLRTGLEGVRESYLELSPHLKHMSFGSLKSFKDILLPSALMGDSKAQELLVSSVFASIADSPLEKSLIAYAQQGFQLKAAARALNVHENTLRYRLERIQKLINLDLQNAETRLYVHLAIKLRELQ